MNVQIKISDLVYLLDSNIVIEQVAKAIKGAAEKSGILMTAPEIGSGYMVWRLPGEGWISFDNLSEDDKNLYASAMVERIEHFKSLIDNPDLAPKITRVPDTKYVYLRDNNGQKEYALTGWAYRFPEGRSGNELETWINRIKKQDISLGFIWDGELMPQQPFSIQNISHKTMADGIFHVGSVPVGSTYAIMHTPTRRSFQLVAEMGKSDYMYDLTQTFTVNVHVDNDSAPMPDATVRISFGDKTADLTTDASGNAVLAVPLAHDGFGCPVNDQPECVAACQGETQSQTPTQPSCILSFNFDFKHEPIPEKIPEPLPPEFVTIDLHDVVGTPVANMPIFLTTKKKKKMPLTTDAEGKCIVPKEWFSPGETMQIEFNMTQEYHDTYGMDLDRKKLKKTK